MIPPPPTSYGTYYTSHYATDWPDFIEKAFCEEHHPSAPLNLQSDTEITEIGLLTKRTPTVDSQCHSTINDRDSRAKP